jgi:hypothetical protein
MNNILWKTLFHQLALQWHLFFFLLIALIAVSILKSRRGKGWVGEKITTAVTWGMLDKDTYRRIDDVIIPSTSGTTQIDHILVSKYGIFVIETKNIQGWIFGNPQSDKWTQSIYGKKSQFQNPLKQNYRHTKSLAEYLQIDHGLIKPVVFFIGDCEFKTPMPSNVLNKGLIPYIKEFSQECLTENQAAEIEGKLLMLKQDKSLNRETHLDSLRERHESTTTCPKCGGRLIERVAKKGSYLGKSFLGCFNYPRCKYMRKD